VGPALGLHEGVTVGNGVGLPATYDGTELGDAEGAFDGDALGSGVGLPCS